MQTTFYPTLDEALYLHQLLIDRYGGMHGVRDLGLIESALYRPQSGYYETLSAQAAALLQSLALNHGFVDGNKRVAFALTMVFVRLNGHRVTVSADDAERFLIDDVIKGRADVNDIARWIAQHLE